MVAQQITFVSQHLRNIRTIQSLQSLEKNLQQLCEFRMIKIGFDGRKRK